MGDLQELRPLTGVVLLVVITLVLATVIGTMVIGLGSSIDRPAPENAQPWSATVDVNDTGHTVTFTYRGNHPVPVELLNVSTSNDTESPVTFSDTDRLTTDSTITVAVPNGTQTVSVLYRGEMVTEVTISTAEGSA